MNPGPPGFFAKIALCVKARCSVLAELRTLRLLWFKKHDLRLFLKALAAGGKLKTQEQISAVLPELSAPVV